MLHDAFLAGGAFVYVPDGVVVEQPIVVLHWSEGDSEASFPHTLVVLGERAEATVLDRFGSPDTEHLSNARRRAARRRPRAPAVPRRCRSTARAPGTSGSSARTSAATRPLRTSAVALGGDYARLRSEALLAGQSAESDQLAVYFGDDHQMLDFRTLQDHDAPWTRSDLLFKGAVEDKAAVRVLRSRAPAEARAEVERVPDQPQPRAHRRRERGVDPEPRDRGERRALLARFDRRADRRGPALLPRVARHAARGSRAPDRARVLRRRVRAPAGERADPPAAAHGHRQARAPHAWQ